MMTIVLDSPETVAKLWKKAAAAGSDHQPLRGVNSPACRESIYPEAARGIRDPL